MALSSLFYTGTYLSETADDQNYPKELKHPQQLKHNTVKRNLHVSLQIPIDWLVCPGPRFVLGTSFRRGAGQRLISVESLYAQVSGVAAVVGETSAEDHCG
eukprot:6069915-Amphidinium_carterae.1